MLALAASFLLASAAGAVDADDDTVVDAWASSTQAYRLRTDGAAADNDASLSLDAGARAFGGRIGADLSGALFADVDGRDGKLDPFASVRDENGAFDLILDTVELRASLAPWLARASVGRLTVDEGQPLTLDGAAVSASPWSWSRGRANLFASAGRTVHFYAFDDGAVEDWTAGGGAGVVLDDTLKAELDYRALVEDSARARMQSSYGASVWGRVDDVFLGRLWARGIDRELSHVGARAHVATPLSAAADVPWQVGVDVEGVEQTATLGEVFEGENPFFAVLGPSLPHLRGSVDAFATDDFGVVDAGLHLGAAGRHVLSGLAGPFNRDFGRVYASAEARDIWVPGPFTSVIVSYDAAVSNGAGVDPAVLAVGGAAGWSSDWLKVSVGTAFDRTRYTYYRDVDELVDVRSYDVSLLVRPLSNLGPLASLRLRAAYTLEVADRVVHTAFVGVSEDLGGAW